MIMYWNLHYHLICMFWETNKMLRDLALCLSILILEDSVKLIFLRGMWNWLMFLVRNSTKNLRRLLLFVNLFSVYLVIRPIYELQNIHQVCHIVNCLSVWWWTNWVWAELGTDTMGRKGSHDCTGSFGGIWKQLLLYAFKAPGKGCVCVRLDKFSNRYNTANISYKLPSNLKGLIECQKCTYYQNTFVGLVFTWFAAIITRNIFC